MADMETSQGPLHSQFSRKSCRNFGFPTLVSGTNFYNVGGVKHPKGRGSCRVSQDLCRFYGLLPH